MTRMSVVTAAVTGVTGGVAGVTGGSIVPTGVGHGGLVVAVHLWLGR
jgi:hypothetical protein